MISICDAVLPPTKDPPPEADASISILPFGEADRMPCVFSYSV